MEAPAGISPARPIAQRAGERGEIGGAASARPAFDGAGLTSSAGRCFCRSGFFALSSSSPSFVGEMNFSIPCPARPAPNWPVFPREAFAASTCSG